MSYQLNKIALIFFLSIKVAHNLTAQSVFELKNIDIIKIDDEKGLSFYQKKGNKYRIMIVDFYNLVEQEKSAIIEKKEWKDFSSLFSDKDQIIYVKNIRSSSSKRLLQYLLEHRFKIRNIDNDGEFIDSYLQVFNPSVALITKKKILEDKQFYRDSHHHFKDFCILHLGNNKHIVIYSLDAETYKPTGYYIHAKDKEYLFIENYKFHKSTANKEYTNNIWVNDINFKEAKDKLNLSNHYFTEETDDHKMILLNNFEKKYYHINMTKYTY